MIRTLVFDLDDTLYSERDYVLSGFKAVGKHLGDRCPNFVINACALFEAGERKKVFDKALAKDGLEASPELITELVGVYRQHRPLIELFDDAQWALNRYKDWYRLGLISDGFLEAQKNKAQALQIHQFIPDIVFTDSLGKENWKPSPLAFERMMQLTGSAGKECCYVGDNCEKDFLAPNRLGWTTIQVVRPSGEYKDRMPKAGYEAQLQIQSLFELEELLLGNLRRAL